MNKPSAIMFPPDRRVDQVAPAAGPTGPAVGPIDLNRVPDSYVNQPAGRGLGRGIRYEAAYPLATPG
jgi:hypothetical protein